VEVELEQEKINLIKKIIVSDKKYADNEDLFEDFFNETYKSSFLILKTIKNEASIEAYLRKIATTAIINVLKNSGRLVRTGEKFVAVKEKSFDEFTSSSENKYENVQVKYDLIDLSDGPEEVIIKKEIQQKLFDAINIAHNLNPAKNYLQLYQLRYVKGLKQKQIAQELNLSQGEISKRLLDLIDEVKITFDNS
jgi:RNA polymerase sigma factor (sigma-70 family)